MVFRSNILLQILHCGMLKVTHSNIMLEFILLHCFNSAGKWITWSILSYTNRKFCCYILLLFGATFTRTIMLNLLMKWPLGSNLSQLYKIIWNLWYKNPWISVDLVKKEKKKTQWRAKSLIFSIRNYKRQSNRRHATKSMWDHLSRPTESPTLNDSVCLSLRLQ